MLNGYEKQLDIAQRESILVIEEYNMDNAKFKGLYCDGIIALNKNMKTTAERSCILAEEIGHYYTTEGNILDLSNDWNRKKELQARLWAYNKLIGLSGIIEAYKGGCKDLYETAEYLEVTEDFLKDTLQIYSSKYGPSVEFEGYIITFIPALNVIQK